MVLDIRQMWSGEGDADDRESGAEPARDSAAKDTGADSGQTHFEVPQDAGAALPLADLVSAELDAMTSTTDSAMDDSEPGIGLAELIQQVATGDAPARARAAAQLRALVPGHDGIELLFDLAGPSDDPRRLPAIQALGHHRHWLSSRSRVETILRLARDERDPELAAALVWTLRQREELREFLLHPMHTVSREAALGVPLADTTIEGIVHALLVGRAPDVDTILAQKLPAMHASLTKMAIDVLQRMASFSSSDEQRLVIENLPQPPLFEALVEGRSSPALNPEPTEGETLALKEWHDLSRLTSQVLLERPRAELIRYLVNRCAADEPFARRHASFLHRAMASTRDALGSEVLDDFERMTMGANEERLERMARLLMELVDKIAGGESHSQAADLLERWKGHSPALKLKIYHMQQGLR